MIQITIYKKGSDKSMDMYQKRKMRQEKAKKENKEKMQNQININCEEWANAKPSRKVDLPTFFA